MIRWAFCRPAELKRNLGIAATMLSAFVLIGCGGGGGGDNGGGGGPASVAGRVVSASALRSPVSGAVVTLRDAQNNVVATQTTDANGNFSFANVPASAVLFRVDPPATGFFQEMARFRSNDYAYNRTANAGGPCIPQLVAGGGALPGGTTTLPDIQVFDNSVPPPPVFSCPR